MDTGGVSAATLGLTKHFSVSSQCRSVYTLNELDFLKYLTFFNSPAYFSIYSIIFHATPSSQTLVLCP